MSNKKILITGAAGKVGSHLVKQLIAKKYDVRILIHKTEPKNFDISKVEIIKGDLTNRSTLLKAVENVDVVCHLAAAFDIFPPYKYEIDNDIVYKINVLGTYNLLEAIRNSSSTKHIILGSSESVYNSDGKEHKEIITEEAEIFPARFYSLTKVIGEDMVKGYHYLYGLDFSILRFGWILDSSDILRIFEYETWEGDIIKNERNNLSNICSNKKALFIPIYKDGSPKVDHVVDAEDAALSIALCVENDSSRGEIFNIAGPYPFKYNDVILEVSKKLRLKWYKGKIIGTFPYKLSIKKAKKTIGYIPKFTIEDTINKALNKIK